MKKILKGLMISALCFPIIAIVYFVYAVLTGGDYWLSVPICFAGEIPAIIGLFLLLILMD